MGNYIETISETISENARREFEEFKKRELAKTKEEIFRDNYKIRFYDELHYFLTESGTYWLQEETLTVLASEGENLISLLYDYYLKREYTSITNWDDICQMICGYCEGRNER